VLQLKHNIRGFHCFKSQLISLFQLDNAPFVLYSFPSTAENELYYYSEINLLNA